MASLSQEPVDRVYLIDNSPDDSLALLAASYPIAQYLHISNRGFGNAHNIAMQFAKEAGSQFHLVLNPDVRWSQPILAHLIEAFHKRPKCALMQPTVTYPDGRLQHTCRLIPTPFDVFAKRFLPNAWIRRRLNRYLLPADAYSREFNAVYMQGSFMLLRMSALEEIGGFDERFFMYPEDIDLTRRIRQRFDAIHYPYISIIHDHQAASSRAGRMLRIHIVNMIRYFNKWGWFFDAGRRKLNRRLRAELDL